MHSKVQTNRPTHQALSYLEQKQPGGKKGHMLIWRAEGIPSSAVSLEFLEPFQCESGYTGDIFGFCHPLSAVSHGPWR